MDTTVTVDNQLLDYASLHFIPAEQKNEHWMATNILFAKLRCKPLVNPDTAATKRALDRGEIKAAEYKAIFDPEDKKAEFVAADWKANPIYIHLNNITEANLEKIPASLNVKAADEYAKFKQQKENARIIGRREYMDFLNDINKHLGYPPLKSTDDPYKYAKMMQQGQLKTGRPTSLNQGQGATPDGLVDSVKSAIYDNEDLALYNEFIYKGDVEIVLELGIKHYLDSNKFPRIAEKLLPDLRHHNTACMRWYTSLTSGKPVLEYLDPSQVHTFHFTEYDGNDNVGWFLEYDITFGDFMRQFGANLTREQLIEVFDLNRQSLAGHGFYWADASIAQKNAARIRIGYIEVETQNRDVFTEGVLRGNLHYQERDSTWTESTNTRKDFKKTRVEKNYNVWYSAYYIPPSISGNFIRTSTVDWQEKYTFKVEMLQDMQRFGDDRRWAKSSLIVWKSDRMSYTDIMERYMPKIHYLWHKFQNELVQDQNGIIYSDDMIKAMLALTDDAEMKGKDAKKELLKRLKQTGQAMAKFSDSEGRPIKPFEAFRSGHMEAAKDDLFMMQQLYLMTTQALGQSQTQEGQDPRPRQSVKGIQLAIQGSTDARYFIEKAYMNIMMEVGERLITYIKTISEEGETQRFKEFRDIVGMANGLMLEEIKDIPLHKFGLTVENVNNDEVRQYVMDLAEKLVTAGMLDIEVLSLLIKIDNWKYAAVLMIMKYKAKQREKLDEQARADAQAAKMKQMDLQMKVLEFKGKADAQIPVIRAQGEVQAMLVRLEAQVKNLSQSMLKEQMKNNRIEQDRAKMQLEEDYKNNTVSNEFPVPRLPLNQTGNFSDVRTDTPPPPPPLQASLSSLDAGTGGAGASGAPDDGSGALAGQVSTGGVNLPDATPPSVI